MAIALLISCVSGERSDFFRKSGGFSLDSAKITDSTANQEYSKSLASTPIGISSPETQRVYIIAASLLIIVALSLLIIRSSKKKKRDIVETSAMIAEKNENIMNSLYFAEGIQRAILPNTEKLNFRLQNYFLVFRPKDIVSGDFYWTKKINGKIFIAVVDCTGHGVPGAFMSLIGYTLLNQIVFDRKIHKSSLVLESLHNNIRAALKQERKDSSANDGMDISFCVIDTDKNILEYSGANRPLLIVRNGAVDEIKGDRKSIGGRQKEDKRLFKAVDYKLEKNDIIYLFTDGITDQHNKIKKKIGKKDFKNYLLKISQESLDKQELLINQLIDSHKGAMDQRDDITVLGYKVE